jgi:hypothetical protein
MTSIVASPEHTPRSIEILMVAAPPRGTKMWAGEAVRQFRKAGVGSGVGAGVVVPVGVATGGVGVVPSERGALSCDFGTHTMLMLIAATASVRRSIE